MPLPSFKYEIFSPMSMVTTAPSVRAATADTAHSTEQSVTYGRMYVTCPTACQTQVQRACKSNMQGFEILNLKKYLKLYFLTDDSSFHCKSAGDIFDKTVDKSAQ